MRQLGCKESQKDTRLEMNGCKGKDKRGEHNMLR